ncbi:MAG TPA: HAMP domain-containing sensor histidine kinase [Acidimicrobiales bacterium]|nr:HAMP domain-containing sensor histidine kinase [Acidimicrobiales bacterium]
MPLRYRAAAGFGLTALALSSALAVVVYSVARGDLVAEREEAAVGQSYVNARLLRSRLAPRPDDIPTLLAGVRVDGGEVLLRIDGQWYSSSIDVSPDELPESLGEVVDSGTAGHQIVDGVAGPQLVVGLPIRAVEAEYYEVTSLEDLTASLATLRRALLIGAGAATLVGGVVGALLTGIVLAPLRSVARVARRVVAGETGSRLDSDGDPDLEPLTGSFNEMLDELNERIRREARFASDVTHELRGPLTTLAASVEIVDRRRDQVPGEVRDAIDALRQQVRSFNRLVLDLLEISRFEAGTARLERRRLDLAELCRAVVEECDHADIPVVAAAPTVASVDPLRVRQVVANLLDNAARYAGGAVQIRVTGSDGRARLEIDDAGPGVRPAERTMIFARFARGGAAQRRGAPGGTGLGLALSSQHIALHGGRIWVEDRPGGGARFVVEIPSEAA